jgi:cephalosporin-C deacetylase-like acetyl esterase
MRFAAVALLCLVAPVGAQTEDSRQVLIAYLNGLAFSKLEVRKQAVSAIGTSAEADKRKAANRATVLRLIGGLPERRGAAAVKEFGSLPGDGFRVEKIAYESLPGYWVTADVFVPTQGGGRFPAVVVTPGHETTSKATDYDYAFGVNLARNGIVTLVLDPMGQGERLQYYDPGKKASLVGGPTAEHSEANVTAMAMGDTIARYMVNDDMRAVDYLTARKDVDGGRIGALGCSGGGAETAYFAALDDRVKVAGSACYITSFEELLGSRTGVQEAEQSIPHFIEEGLDFGDWVEMAAPKPYAIISTTGDMFPLAGARQTYEEAKRIYGLYGAEERLQWITGPGGHANLFPIAPAILAFFTKYLKGAEPNPAWTTVRPPDASQLTCTPTGQVSTSLNSKPISAIMRERADALKPPHLDPASLRREVRALAGITAQPGAPPPSVESLGSEPREGYRLEKLSMDGLPMLLAVPEGAGPGDAVLLLAADPQEELERLAKSGHVVLAVRPRPWPGGSESAKAPLLGNYNLLGLRAFLVGKTLVGLRVDDAIQAMNWLCARKEVAAGKIEAYGKGPQTVVLLHAALLDTRIGAVTLEDGLVSYRMIADTPLHRNASEVLVPGALRKYDLTDLVTALAPRKVTVLSPRDATGAPAGR